MSDNFDDCAPWVLFKLNNQILGIPAQSTYEMITIPDVTPVPRVPEFVRGVINIRGLVIALLDLRVKLNQPSLAQEAEELAVELNKRRQEHIDWVNTLEQSVKDGVSFSLNRDPHQCAFGKWYDSYKPLSPSMVGLLANFDFPHKAIHLSADQVDELLRTGAKKQAIELVTRLKETHMVRILGLFDQLIQGLQTSHQEIAIVVEHNNNIIALTVDSVEAVEPLLSDSVENLPGNMGPDSSYIITMMGRRSSNNEPVLIPDLERIINDTKILNVSDSGF